MSCTTTQPAPAHRRRGLATVAFLAALVLLLAACGGAGDDTSDTTAAETTDTTAAETTDTTAAETTDTTAAEAAGDALAVELGEWFVSAPEGITAGTLTFAVDNVGENPHAFAIARGTSYEELPQKDNGAVDTDALGDEFLGTTDNIASGESATIEFDLEAGDYVFFCPIEFGPNSHAGNGQVLSVTVGG